MDKFEKRRDSKLVETIILSRFVYIAVSFMLMYNKRAVEGTIVFTQIHVVDLVKLILPMAIICAIQFIGLVSSFRVGLSDKWGIHNTIECIGYICALIYVLDGNWMNSFDKFMPILFIIAYSVQFKNHVGYILAAISSVLIIIPVIFLSKETGSPVSVTFQRDAVLCSSFFFIVYIINTFVSIQNEYNEQVKHMANVDGLTGVYNRRFFSNSLKSEIEKAKLNNDNVSIIILDIDFFKKFNDTHGHVEGDRLLIDISALFKKFVGDRGILARYGGEEFIIIVPKLEPEKVVNVANKLQKLVEETYFEGQETQPNGNVTISIGVSSYPKLTDNSSCLVETADEALYKSKETGRNKVTCYIKDQM